jgi:hypothetical protein
MPREGCDLDGVTSMRRAVYTAATVARLTPIVALFGKFEILTRFD